MICQVYFSSNISILTKLFLALAQCFAMLCNCCKLTSCKPNQWCQDSNKLLHLLEPLHSIYSSSICIPNTTREPKQFFICWCCCCCCCHWQQLFFICITLSSLKRILSWWFYSIYALELLASHNSSIGCHWLSQSWDLRLVNLMRLVGKRKSGWKARKGRNPFVVLLMSSDHGRPRWI